VSGDGARTTEVGKLQQQSDMGIPVWKLNFCFLLLICFCWLAVRAVAGLARPLVAFAAVLCCAVAAAAVHGRLPITVADCEAAADYGGRCTRCCAVAVAVACCFAGGSGTQ